MAVPSGGTAIGSTGYRLVRRDTTSPAGTRGPVPLDGAQNGLDGEWLVQDLGDALGNAIFALQRLRCGDPHHRYRPQTRVILALGEKLPAVHARHHEVEDDDDRELDAATQTVHGRPSVTGGGDRI